MSSSKVTVFPVPVSRPPPEEHAPSRMEGEIEGLRAENTLLRQRLAAVEMIALEREGTIEDLRHALQMLPSVWAEKLEGKVGQITEESVPTPASAQTAVRPPEAVTAPDNSATASAPAGDSYAAIDQAEALAEIAALRLRLERRQLEAEQEILEQERRRLLADIEWTRKWQRSRGRGLPAIAE